MDPLSDVLSVLKPSDVVARGFDMGGEWAIQFACHQGIKCYALISGGCWLTVDTVTKPVRLEEGDCFLLPKGLPFRLSSDLDAPVVDAALIFQSPHAETVPKWSGGGGTFGFGGYFRLPESYARVLASELPPVVHIHSEADKAELRWCLERISQEVRGQRPGSSVIAQQLATMLLVQALRLLLEENTRGRTGWLFALADPQLNAAMTAMHNNPAQPWTLQALAELSGMSRTIFAAKFKEVVGSSPMDYLTTWRMLTAGDKLLGSAEPVSGIARSLGYDSESAFTKAFKRVMSSTPRDYRRRSQETHAYQQNFDAANAQALPQG